MKLFSFLYPKEEVALQLHVNEELIETLPKPLVNEQQTESQTTDSFTQGSSYCILLLLLNPSRPHQIAALSNNSYF